MWSFHANSEKHDKPVVSQMADLITLGKELRLAHINRQLDQVKTPHLVLYARLPKLWQPNNKLGYIG